MLKVHFIKILFLLKNMFWTSPFLTLWSSSLICQRPGARLCSREWLALQGLVVAAQAEQPRRSYRQSWAWVFKAAGDGGGWEPVPPRLCFRSRVGSSVAQLGRSKHNGGRKGLTEGACTGGGDGKETQKQNRRPLTAPPPQPMAHAHCHLWLGASAREGTGQEGTQKDLPWLINVGFNSK